MGAVEKGPVVVAARPRVEVEHPEAGQRRVGRLTGQKRENVGHDAHAALVQSSSRLRQAFLSSRVGDRIRDPLGEPTQ